MNKVSPFSIGAPGYFTDSAHSGHISIGFGDKIDKDWQALRRQATAAPEVLSPEAVTAQ